LTLLDWGGKRCPIKEPLIKNVSDTALWVASYRAQESQRSDALFRDPLAGRLAGQIGERIAKDAVGGRFVEWSVVIRTCIIDDFINTAIRDGVDTIVNLGAGLDTRPYRMDLPADLRWIEVDQKSIIDHKNEVLASEVSRCRLQRISLDLSLTSERQQLFQKIANEAKKVFVLTEGVVMYLTEESVAALARDLCAQPKFRYWVAEYFTPELVKYMWASSRRRRQMRHSPMLFRPHDWIGFFNQNGWAVKKTCYMGEESVRRGRKVPLPRLFEILRPVLPGKFYEKSKRYSGYIVMEPC